ncbi:MAG: ferredoxin [Verrucomicrobiales bacterium]
MADKTQRNRENVQGVWYTDSNCIICGLCSEYAPSIFKPNDDFEHNYVFKQPETPEEEALALECKESCPTDAIGNDGDLE